MTTDQVQNLLATQQANFEEDRMQALRDIVTAVEHILTHAKQAEFLIEDIKNGSFDVHSDTTRLDLFSFLGQIALSGTQATGEYRQAVRSLEAIKTIRWQVR